MYQCKKTTDAGSTPAKASHNCICHSLYLPSATIDAAEDGHVRLLPPDVLSEA